LDVLFSNALLQWVPGHLKLFAGWVEDLAPGGRLAFSVPDNFDEPGHRLLAQLCASPPWSNMLEGRVSRRRARVHPLSVYADTLLAAGADVEAWTTTYLHRLRGPDPVLAWMSGTGLRPVLAALESEPA